MNFGEEGDHGSGGDNSNNDTNNLQDSEYSADSTSANGSYGDDSVGGGGRGWLPGMGADLRNIVHCLTDNVPPVMSGMANLVHQTFAAVANEIALLEKDGEREAAGRRTARNKVRSDKNEEDDEEEEDHDDGVEGAHVVLAGTTASFESKQGKTLSLPWEIRQDSLPPPPQPRRGKKEPQPRHLGTSVANDDPIPVYVTDNEIMEAILGLSRQESTFLRPFAGGNTHDGGPTPKHGTTRRENDEAGSVQVEAFVLDKARIGLIRRLLDIDSNLATMHIRFATGKNKEQETRFWKNYFYHCEKVRAERLQQRRKKGNPSSPSSSLTSATKPSTITTQGSAGSFSAPSHNVLVPNQPGDVAIETVADSSSMRRSLEQIFSSMGDDDDDGSLVATKESIDEEDDSSYVVASAPNSVNTFATTKSLGDDFILVNTQDYQANNKGKTTRSRK